VPRPVDSTRTRRRLGWWASAAVGFAYAASWLVNRSLRRVEGPSMLPSLWPGDLLVTVPATRVRPRPGDVVVAEVDGRRVTKRLAAPPGSRVELHDGHLLVDGTWWATPDAVPVDEDAAWDPSPGRAVLLGDHRARSTDARGTGPVRAGAIDRVAVARVRPPAWLRGRTAPVDGPRRRPGVRLVVLDPDDRVLLFRVRDADGGDATWWEAPGGGRRVGELPADAARRELAEEVGATAPTIVPLHEVHVRRTRLAGAALEKVEDLFAVRLEDPTVDDRGWTTSEVRDIAEVRWWSPDELTGPEDPRVVPADLARLVRAASTLV
jgi:signal peptidase I